VTCPIFGYELLGPSGTCEELNASLAALSAASAVLAIFIAIAFGVIDHKSRKNGLADKKKENASLSYIDFIEIDEQGPNYDARWISRAKLKAKISMISDVNFSEFVDKYLSSYSKHNKNSDPAMRAQIIHRFEEMSGIKLTDEST
jgi:hypothetical protein